MDIKKRMLLQHHQQDIVRDLDVKYILDELFTKSAITTEDFDHIYNLTNRAERARYLIEKLLQSGSNNAYEAFVGSLVKDYRWLWEKLAVENNEAMLEDSFEDSLSRGDVPRLPDHFVRREVLEEELLIKLINLKRHRLLILHGMSGCGKSVLAISVLRGNPKLITTNFNGVVFWLNLSNCKTEDDIIAQQNKLYRKASLICTQNSNMNSSISMSSIGSYADSSSNYDWTYEELKDRLKSQFTENALKDALLVLDEVNEKKILEAFDIGCKILGTTRDTEVVANFHPQILKVENHLTESESLLLLASCLDTETSRLPRQAKKLHEICKGSPFHIALIGAELAEHKERLIDDHKHWNYYLKKLEKKEMSFFPRNGNPMKTVELCITSLKPDMLALFKMLTILPDNIKVSAKVLSKLWNKEVVQVESIMKQLRSKSLIIEYYDREQRNYIYEVHGLIMSYLRSSSNEEEVKKLHANFLKSYNYDNLNDLPVEIEDDGYIAFYIGYHLANTKNYGNMWSFFNKLYMDLKFLGNKVRLTGPADVILDLQKYENYITYDELDITLLYTIKEYLNTYGIDLYRYSCTDIIQSILQNESKGPLYTRASQVAQERCLKNELYFEFLHEPNVEELKHSTIDVKEQITSVCFLGDYVLIGTDTGVIKFFHIPTNKCQHQLQCGGPVLWVGACPLVPALLGALVGAAGGAGAAVGAAGGAGAAGGVGGVGGGGSLALWFMDDLHHDHHDAIDEESEESYNNNYPSHITIPPKLGPFLNCRWANNKEILITHTSKIIILYSTKGEILQVLDKLFRDRDILYCIPCNDDKRVIVATSHTLEVVDLKTKEKQVFEETAIALDIVAVPGTDRILTLKEKEVTEIEFQKRHRYNQNATSGSKTVISSGAVKESVSFISMAVNKTGTLLFASTDDNRVICVDLKTNSYVFDLENRRGNVSSMSVSEVSVDLLSGGADVLLTASDADEHCAKVWVLQASYVAANTHAHGKVRLTTKFDANFLNITTPSPTISSTNTTPKRNHSFVNQNGPVVKIPIKSTMSLDRYSLKPLNLNGICNGNYGAVQPLLAVVDDKHNIQIMRGRQLITEITAKLDEQITIVRISPCNQYVMYGLNSGIVKKFTVRSKEIKVIMDVYSPVQYLNFVNSNLMIVGGKNKCLMAYRLAESGEWKPQMLQKGNCNLGSQEILNDIQGKKKSNQSSKMSNQSSKTSNQSRMSSSDSESSTSSKDRFFPNGVQYRLCKGNNLVDCYWVQDMGLITIESNATIKLWDQNLNVASVLHGRQMDVCVYCSAYQKNILVICDNDNQSFQTFELQGDQLHLIQEYRQNNKIYSCALTADGNILALGLDSGDVVIWSVHTKRQLNLLKHHKSKVQWCSFSPGPARPSRLSALYPVPDRLSHLSSLSPVPDRTSRPPSLSPVQDRMSGMSDDEPPLVLVSMATEIVWWNITHVLRTRASKGNLRAGMNAVTPIPSPLDPRIETQTRPTDRDDVNRSSHFSFDTSFLNPQQCWKTNWKFKTYKEGSKRKEILSCIKLSGMNAKQICYDEKFSCFVTVDNPGLIHIMTLMN